MNHPLAVGIIHLLISQAKLRKQHELFLSQLRLTRFKSSSNCNLNKRSRDKKNNILLSDTTKILWKILTSLRRLWICISSIWHVHWKTYTVYILLLLILQSNRLRNTLCSDKERLKLINFCDFGMSLYGGFQLPGLVITRKRKMAINRTCSCSPSDWQKRSENQQKDVKSCTRK